MTVNLYQFYPSTYPSLHPSTCLFLTLYLFFSLSRFRRQNEENLRRYRNPLQNPVYEMSDCSIVSPSTCSINSPFEMSLQQQQQQQQHQIQNRKSCVAALPQQQQQQRQNYYSNCSGDEDIFEIERTKGVGGGVDEALECGGSAKTSQSYPTNLSGAASSAPGGGSNNAVVGHHYANLHTSEVNIVFYFELQHTIKTKLFLKSLNGIKYSGVRGITA